MRQVRARVWTVLAAALIHLALVLPTSLPAMPPWALVGTAARSGDN